MAFACRRCPRGVATARGSWCRHRRIASHVSGGPHHPADRPTRRYRGRHLGAAAHRHARLRAAFITSDAAYGAGPNTRRRLLRESEDAALAETNDAGNPVAETVLRSECRHHFLLERRIGEPLGPALILSRLTLQLQPALALDVASPRRTSRAEVGLALHHHDPDRSRPRPAALVGADHLYGPEITPPAPVLRRRLGAAGGHERQCQCGAMDERSYDDCSPRTHPTIPDLSFSSWKLGAVPIAKDRSCNTTTSEPLSS